MCGLHVSPFADLRDVGGLLQRAGFALPVTDLDRVVVRYDNAFALMQDLRRMAEIERANARMQPVLVGTASIEKSERSSSGPEMISGVRASSIRMESTSSTMP